MAEVLTLPTVLLTVNQFCKSALCDNATVARRLSASNVEPHSKKGKQHLYRLRDLLHVAYVADEHGNIDADKLSPFARRAHYQSEMQKLKLQQECRELIPRIEVEQEFGRVAKTVVRFLESLPDVLERDYGLAPAAVERIATTIDEMRDEIYDTLVAPVTDEAPAQLTDVAP